MDEWKHIKCKIQIREKKILKFMKKNENDFEIENTKNLVIDASLITNDMIKL